MADPAALFSDHVTSRLEVPLIKLDVSADMSFGNRFFLVSLFLGIVLIRYNRCNQGEFKDALRRHLTLFSLVC